MGHITWDWDTNSRTSLPLPQINLRSMILHKKFIKKELSRATEIDRETLSSTVWSWAHTWARQEQQAATDGTSTKGLCGIHHGMEPLGWIISALQTKQTRHLQRWRRGGGRKIRKCHRRIRQVSTNTCVHLHALAGRWHRQVVTVHFDLWILPLSWENSCLHARPGHPSCRRTPPPPLVLQRLKQPAWDRSHLWQLTVPPANPRAPAN